MAQLTRTLRCGQASFVLEGDGARTIIMGVLNVTPDSFSDGGRYVDVGVAVAHAQALLAAGADVIDVGGESTRPGAVGVDVDVELARVIPVVRALSAAGVDAISVDTRRPKVAAGALQAGARWINDVSGLAEPCMTLACAEADAVVLMHWQQVLTQPKDSAHEDHVVDEDIVGSVGAYLAERVGIARAAGISAERIIVDPGIGFGKTVAHNVTLSRALANIRTRSGAAAIMYGPSRKRFLGALTGRAEAADRDGATVGAVCAAIAYGADIVRVHNVAAVRDAVVVADAIVRG